MQTVIISSIEAALPALGDLVRPGRHALVTNNPHVPGQAPSKSVVQSDANVFVTEAAQDDFPGTQIEVDDYQLLDVLPTTVRDVGGYYLVDSVTYKCVRSKRYMAGDKVVLYVHLVRPTAAEGFTW